MQLISLGHLTQLANTCKYYIKSTSSFICLSDTCNDLKSMSRPPMVTDIYIPPDAVLSTVSKYSNIIQWHFLVAVILMKNFWEIWGGFSCRAKNLSLDYDALSGPLAGGPHGSGMESWLWLDLSRSPPPHPHPIPGLHPFWGVGWATSPQWVNPIQVPVRLQSRDHSC